MPRSPAVGRRVYVLLVDVRRVMASRVAIGTFAARRAAVRWVAVRRGANWVNLSTPCGLLLAWLSGCRVVPGQRGLHYALGYTPRLPVAHAFTVGNVVLFRPQVRGPEDHPRLLAHEETHCTQYALCLGLPFLPLYFAAAGWSWLRTGDPASRNVFERRAGLAAGGYREHPVRPLIDVLNSVNLLRGRRMRARGARRVHAGRDRPGNPDRAAGC